MNAEEKLEILINADFSEWRQWIGQHLSEKEISEIHGFGTVFSGLYGAITNLADGIMPEVMIDLASKAYSLLCGFYSTIPFYRMDPSDEDFKFLFEYRQLLEELGQRLAPVLNSYRTGHAEIGRDSSEYNYVLGILNSMRNHNYRRDILSKWCRDLT